jgi:Na+-translocating ferredoxin:NAD+ oxidoreductase RnfG subunit
MKFNQDALLMLAGTVIAGIPIYAQAKIYVSAEQAQKLLFPNKQFSKYPFVLSEDIQEKMQSASSVSHPFKGDRTWKAADGSYFIVDEVVGKHEMITYAVGIAPNGSVQGIEILEYVESYGYEVAEDGWLKQFVGKTADDPLKLKKDIQNISGATLSCKHLTDGVKRVMVMYDLALKAKSK